MIKINLCPIDELESQYWFVPDVAAALVVAVAGFFGVQYYLGTIESQAEEVAAKTASLQDSSQKLQPDLERFKGLDNDVKQLNTKLTALKSITVSKIAKYRPVIVLEHLQNLKPEGVWYSLVRIGIPAEGGGGATNLGAAGAGAAALPGAPGAGVPGTGGPGSGGDSEDFSFEIKGQAFDNILVAELMAAIRSTASQDYDAADLRTQVYFSNDASFKLTDTQVPKSPPGTFPELGKFPEFGLHGRFAERSAAVMPQGGPGATMTAPPPGPGGDISEADGPAGGPVNF